MTKYALSRLDSTYVRFWYLQRQMPQNVSSRGVFTALIFGWDETFCADFHGDILIRAGLATYLWAISVQNSADVGAQPMNCQCAKFNFVP